MGNYPQIYELLRFGANPKYPNGNIKLPVCVCHHREKDILDLPSPCLQLQYKVKILKLLKNPPITYKQELIDKRNLLAMILNKRISLGTIDDIKQMLISIGY